MGLMELVRRVQGDEGWGALSCRGTFAGLWVRSYCNPTLGPCPCCCTTTTWPCNPPIPLNIQINIGNNNLSYLLFLPLLPATSDELMLHTGSRIECKTLRHRHLKDGQKQGAWNHQIKTQCIFPGTDVFKTNFLHTKNTVYELIVYDDGIKTSILS